MTEIGSRHHVLSLTVLVSLLDIFLNYLQHLMMGLSRVVAGGAAAARLQVFRAVRKAKGQPAYTAMICSSLNPSSRNLHGDAMETGTTSPFAVGVAAALGLLATTCSMGGGSGMVACEESAPSGAPATTLPTKPISITSNFDSGNIQTAKIDGTQVDLNIRSEPFTEGTDKACHAQWYHFKASNLVVGKKCTFRILNAGKCSYAPGFVGYRSCCSYDHETWFRIPTDYNESDGVMTFSLTPEQDTVWFAYFAPFSYEEHQRLIARCQQSPLARVKSLGHSLDGRDLDLVTVGTGKLKAWFTARQHPGESQAEHWMDGFLARLLDPDDALAKRLRALCTFYVVPNVNPDGSLGAQDLVKIFQHSSRI